MRGSFKLLGPGSLGGSKSDFRGLQSACCSSCCSPELQSVTQRSRKLPFLINSIKSHHEHSDVKSVFPTKGCLLRWQHFPTISRAQGLHLSTPDSVHPSVPHPLRAQPTHTPSKYPPSLALFPPSPSKKGVFAVCLPTRNEAPVRVSVCCDHRCRPNTQSGASSARSDPDRHLPCECSSSSWCAILWPLLSDMQQDPPHASTQG